MRSKSLATAVVLGLLAAAVGMVATAGAHRVYSSMADAVADGTNVFVGGVLAGADGGDPSAASHNPDMHSRNVRKLDREFILHGPNDRKAEGSDLAFQGRLMVAGSYQGTAFYRMNRSRTDVEQISFHDCPGSQGDVSIWQDYVFVSIDSPSSNDRKTAVCNNTDTQGQDPDQSKSNTSRDKEGIRVLDISNLHNPRQVAFVETECGSHTHTLVPENGALYMYVDSYPIQQSVSCNDLNHDEGEFSVLRVPDNARRTHIVSTPDVLGAEHEDAVGCHDTGVLPKKDLAVAACLGRTAILNISDPADPRTQSVINNPAIELDHTGQMTWDGKIAVIGDEHAGAAGGGGCSTNQESPIGAMWYYDIDDRSNPILLDSHSLPRVPQPDSLEEAERFRCTTHNFSIVPTENSNRYVAVSAYYMGGLAVVNFSRVDNSPPGEAKERGWYIPEVNGKLPDMWSAYWYNGKFFTNEHASKLGVSIFERRRGLGAGGTRFFTTRMNPQTHVGPLR